jgi:hypothetical protein
MSGWGPPSLIWFHLFNERRNAVSEHVLPIDGWWWLDLNEQHVTCTPVVGMRISGEERFLVLLDLAERRWPAPETLNPDAVPQLIGNDDPWSDTLSEHDIPDLRSRPDASVTRDK